MLANVCKHNVTRFPYEIARLAQDLAGGLMATLPSEKDFNEPGDRAAAREVPARPRRRADRGPAARCCA